MGAQTLTHGNELFITRKTELKSHQASANTDSTTSGLS